MRTLTDRYRFFRAHAGDIVGKSAVYAIALARAEEAAERFGLVVRWEDDPLPWDGECEAPKHLLWGAVYRSEIRKPSDRHALASLGSVGIDSLRDPYLRVCAAELFAEALDVLDAEHAESAAQLAERATYAAGEARL